MRRNRLWLACWHQLARWSSLTLFLFALLAVAETTGLAQGSISFTNVLGPQTLTNDNFADSTIIQDLNVIYRGDLQTATHELGERFHAGQPGVGSRWYSWIAPTNGVLHVQLDQDQPGPLGHFLPYLIGIYTGDAIDTLVEVQHNDPLANNNGGGTVYLGNPTAKLNCPVIAGVVYHIALDSTRPSQQTTTIQFSFSPSPVNDDFENSTIITDTSLTYSADLSGASKEPGEPDHSGRAGGTSVWWTWTAPLDGFVNVHTDAPGEPLLAVYTGSNVDALTLVTDQIHGPVVYYPLAKTVSFTAQKGQAYNIVLDYSSQPLWTPKIATLNLSFTPFPTNDSFAARTVLVGDSVNVSGSTLLATDEPGEPAADVNTRLGSVWYSWTALFTGYAMLKGDQNSSLSLKVYTGSNLGNLNLVADAAPGKSTSFLAQAGTEYFISVRMSAFGQVGPFLFSLGRAPVTISQPLRNSEYWNSTNIPILAVLDPSNTNVQWVSFYDGLNFLYEADTPPYTFSWSNALAGDHSLSAISVGDTTNVSSFVNIRVHPSNDHFTNSTQLSGTNLGFVASIAFATSELGESATRLGRAGQTCWWTWTAPQNGVLVLSPSGQLYLPWLSVYTGDDLLHLTQLAGKAGRVSLPVQAGQTYHISADSYMIGSYFPGLNVPPVVAPVSPFSLRLQLVASPANDNFEKRSPLTGTTIKVRGSNLGAGTQANEPAHGGIFQGSSIWYSWKAPISGSVTLATNSIVIKTNLNPAPSTFPFPPIFIYPNPGPPAQWGTGTAMPSDYPVFAIYTGSSLAKLTNIASGPVVRFDAVAGQTYQIAVDGNQADPANLQFYLNEVPPAANDDFYRAPSIFGDTQVTGSNLGATVQPGEPRSNAGDTSGHSIWWTWRASKPGICLLNLTQSDDWFTPVTVYVGNSPGALRSVGSGRGYASFVAIPGVPYHICVGSDQGYTGNIRMNIHQYPLTINTTPIVTGVSGGPGRR